MPDDPNPNPQDDAPIEPNNVCRLRPTPSVDCLPQTQRKECADAYRDSEANRACTRDLEPAINRNNGEEDDIVDPTTGERLFAANSTKGMPHNQIGEVVAATQTGTEGGEPVPDEDRPAKAYDALLKAVNTQVPADFEAIPLGPNGRPARPLRRFVDPQAGVAFDTEGPDPASAATYRASLNPPSPILLAPRFETPWLAADVGELYLMALLRDVPLNKFVGATSTNQRITDAVRLINQFTGYRGPSVNGQVTPQTLFRGGNVLSRPKTEDQSQNVGELVGPHLSQFLVIGSRLDDAFPPQFAGGESRSAAGGAAGISLRRTDGQVLFGTQTIDQRQFEVVRDLDFITDYEEWLTILQGQEPDPADGSRYTGQRRFLYSLRQLAEYVHRDQTYQEGLIACLLIISMFERAERRPELGPLFNPGNPYIEANSRNQMGFGTFGNGHVLALLAEATTRAIKAAWYQKWYNQRRLRPEVLGGRIHNVLTNAVPESRYDLNREITGLGNAAPGKEIMDAIFAHNAAQNAANPNRPDGGTYLLPQQYPEGSPLHPAYPAGHATQIAAEVTVMKGLWNGDFLITDPTPPSDPIPPELDVALVPNDDGTALVPYRPPQDQPNVSLTLAGELNKLAANVALARSFAGVHYRLDYSESMLLGEYIGLGILQEQARSFNNDGAFFELTLFSGIRVRVLSDGRIEQV